MTNKTQIADLRKEIDQPGAGSPMQLRKLAHSLLNKLETAETRNAELENMQEVIKKECNYHPDTAKDAFIPNCLDAWGRPVPQYLPYDFSGNPGASATQYCNGWNDSGGYWLKHVAYLQSKLLDSNTELAKLKGDAVPVGEMVSVLRGLQRQSEVAWRGGLVPVKGTKLFTHPRPVPVVVLHPVHHFYGNQYYSKYMVDKALKAAGITVLSADDEEK